MPFIKAETNPNQLFANWTSAMETIPPIPSLNKIILPKHMHPLYNHLL